MAHFSQNDGVKNGNGKRERGDQEDDPEFMPLSKRINNIHLSPERVLNGSCSSSTFNNPNIPRPALNFQAMAPPQPHINGVIQQNPMQFVPEYQIPIRTSNGMNDGIQYRPSLNHLANPHYYEANRALFQLYVERQLRNNLEIHPNVYGRPNIESSSLQQ